MLSAELRSQRMAQQGIVVIKCDNRGSSRRGLAFEGAMHRDMGNVEVVDQSTAVRHFAASGLIDPARVGMFGWSYGGYMSAMSLCRAPDVFSCAVAGAPVTSWDGYDTHYTGQCVFFWCIGFACADNVLLCCAPQSATWALRRTTRWATRRAA